MTDHPRARQYVACRFSPNAEIAYTYHNDGPPVAKGDQVRVPSGKGEKVVTVSKILAKPPGFVTKAILGPKAEPQQRSLI